MDLNYSEERLLQSVFSPPHTRLETLWCRGKAPFCVVHVAFAAFGLSSCQFATYYTVLECFFSPADCENKNSNNGWTNQVIFKGNHIPHSTWAKVLKCIPAVASHVVLPPPVSTGTSFSFEIPADNIIWQRGENQIRAYVTYLESQSEDDQQMPPERRTSSVVRGHSVRFSTLLCSPCTSCCPSPPCCLICRLPVLSRLDQMTMIFCTSVLKMMTMVISKPGICSLNFQLQSVLIHNQSLCFARRTF